jgi:hypothetical protein
VRRSRFLVAALLVLPVIAIARRGTATFKAGTVPVTAVQLWQGKSGSEVLLGDLPKSLGSRCVLLSIISPHCSVCTRMRHTWSGRVRELAASANVQLASAWLATTGFEEAKAFVNGTESARIPLFAVPDSASVGFRPLRVPGTPTTILFNSAGVEQIRIYGELLPTEAQLVEGCSG